MLLILLYSFSFNVLLAASTENAQRYLNDYVHGHGTDKTVRNILSAQMVTNHNPTFMNMTYIDKEENVVRVPDLKEVFNEHHNKRKILKKSPKRTIQKIIKKNKSRRKYLNQATSLPTKPPSNVYDLEKFYAQEEMLQRNESLNTQVNQHNKNKKRWNSRTVKYQMPYQNVASKKVHYKRNKRSDDREDIFILTDLDEVEFLNKDKEDNVVKAHIKKYW